MKFTKKELKIEALGLVTAYLVILLAACTKGFIWLRLIGLAGLLLGGCITITDFWDFCERPKIGLKEIVVIAISFFQTFVAIFFRYLPLVLEVSCVAWFAYNLFVCIMNINDDLFIGWRRHDKSVVKGYLGEYNTKEYDNDILYSVSAYTDEELQSIKEKILYGK